MSCESYAADTSATSLAVTKDETISASTEWLYMEPNEYSSFSATIEKTARDPISKDRQRRKGTNTSVTASPAFTADMTLDMIAYFIPGFTFSVWEGLQPESYAVNSVDGTTETYSVDAGAALAAGMLVYASGWAMPENNGLKTVASGTATTVVVNEDVVDETAPGSARLYVVGVRGATGDLEIDTEGNLISTTLDFTTLGLVVGQYIHIGGQAAANRFATADNFGLARVVTVSANKVELLSRGTTFTTDNGAGQDVDILFSGFCRNYDVGDANFNKQWYHMEATYNTETTLYEYADCALNNTLSINNSVSDKTVMDLGFVAKDIPAPVTSARDGTRSNQVRTEAYNTSSDIVRLSLRDGSDTGLTTFFKDTNLTLTNNVAPEYVLGQLTAEFINFGNFEVDIDTQAVFTDGVILNAIRNNTTLSLDLAYRNGDGGFVIHLPSGTLGDGSKNFERNAKVKITSPFAAHRDETLGYTMGTSLFWYLPTA